MKTSLSLLRHSSLRRPKCFVVVTVSGEAGEVEAYVRAWPLLLKLRIALAARAAKKTYKKLSAMKKILAAKA